MPMAAVLITACSGKKSDAGNDSVIVYDSDLRPVEITVPDSIAADTVQAYLSEDLKKFGLHGKVRSVKTKDYSSFVTCLSGPLDFNENGILTSTFTELPDNEISCNSEGLIDKTECHESDGTTFEFEFTGFDTDGNPISGKYKSEGSGELWVVTFIVSYLDFDREMNWTKRTFKGKSVTWTMNADGKYGRPQNESFEATESRVISYY